MTELLIRGARLLDTKTGAERPADVAVDNGCITAVTEISLSPRQ